MRAVCGGPLAFHYANLSLSIFHKEAVSVVEKASHLHAAPDALCHGYLGICYSISIPDDWQSSQFYVLAPRYCT
jgi:hypothetical protein